ncbi:nuclease [Prevotella dentalis DSM 3688]|uniref:Nuclease n=1 Tax=Prevotella dentalis (strain ATCC 49559 / DSM 3688 / JCM 13448 / NCTC 12043 / ES 2772) TaxID=908937 RepID=F9D276_PREDD|nr:nuclease [Prevotella dentalis DSM 3688]
MLLFSCCGARGSSAATCTRDRHTADALRLRRGRATITPQTDGDCPANAPPPAARQQWRSRLPAVPHPFGEGKALALKKQKAAGDWPFIGGFYLILHQ